MQSKLFKFLFIFTLFNTCMLFADPENGCELDGNTLFLSQSGSVFYNSQDDIGGFQFNVDGASILGVSGGDAASSGFTVQGSGTTVLGFSFSGGTIVAGCGTLTELTLNGNATGLSGIVMSDPSGNSIDFLYYDEIGDDGGCDDIDGDGICADVADCVGQLDECGVCNGNGIADGSCDCNGSIEDCSGVCGGSATEDECGVCDGDGSSCLADWIINVGGDSNSFNPSNLDVEVIP